MRGRSRRYWRERYVFVFLRRRDVCQRERVILMYVQGVVQDIDVVVCTGLGRKLISWHRYRHMHKIRGWIIADNGLGVPEFPVESQDTSSAEYAVRDPDKETRPYEDVPFAVCEDLDMVIHRP